MVAIPKQKTTYSHRLLSAQHPRLWAVLCCILSLCSTSIVPAQELLLKEDFNTDGAGTRYFVEGGGGFEGLPTTGPAYWSRNVDVLAMGKVVGVPAPAPAKRAVLMFNHLLNPDVLTPEALQLIDQTIKWLTDGKAKLNVMFSAAASLDGTGDQLLVQRLTEQGHTVFDDDAGTTQSPDGLPDPATVDLVINGSSAGEPARLARYAVPLLTYRSAISGDLLLATRGETSLTVDPGEVEISAPNHPIAAGLPAKFTYVAEAQPFDTIGLGLPAAATVIASYQFTDAAGVTKPYPLLVVIDKDAQMLGGLLSGFDGAYWAAADLNEPLISNDEFGSPTVPRSLTLKPVRVTGKTKVKLTFAVAGTDVDFDVGADDFLTVKLDVDGDGPEEFTEFVRFGSPSASEKFYTDGKTRVGIIAQDVTYDIPDGATDLVVRFESNSTFWNEIVAFDDVRITAGDAPTAPSKINIALSDREITLSWTGSAILETAPAVNGPWTAVTGAASGYKAQLTGNGAFYRLRGQ